MKILILQDEIPPFSYGGAGVVALALAKEFFAHGHEIVIVTSVRNERDAAITYIDGIKIYGILINHNIYWRNYFSLANFSATRAVSEILKIERPDIVHAHNIHQYLSYHCIKLANDNRIKIFFTAHDVMLFSPGKVDGEERVSAWQEFSRTRTRYNPFRRLIIRYYSKFLEKIVCVSKSAERALNNNGYLNTTVIYNGLNVDSCEENRNISARLRINLNLTNKKIILFVGRTRGGKAGGLFEFIEDILRRYDDVVLLVVGPKEMSMDNPRIIFTGPISRDSIMDYYFLSKVVVFPSMVFETFGLVPLEAMMAAKPVVASAIGGVKEVVVDQETGFLVDPFNADEWKNKISELLINDERGYLMGRMGFIRAKEEFNIRDKADEYLDLFSDSLKQEI